MNTSAPPDILRTICELDAGQLEADIRTAAADVAKAVRDLGGKVVGKMSINLVFEPAKGSGQLLIQHKLTYQRPTEGGKLMEEKSGETAVYVNDRGHCSILPERQMGLDFNTQETARG